MNLKSKSTHVSTSTQTVVLPRTEWEVIFSEVDGVKSIERVQPIPESWFDLRKIEGLPANVTLLALLTCPKCREVNALAKGVTKIDSLGKLIPNFVCGVSTCKFTAEVYLDKFHDKPLYALALENGERIELSYTHANNVKEASLAVSGKLLSGWRVIGIGPAIGYHVQPGSKGSVVIA